MPEGRRPGITRVVCAAAEPALLAPVFRAIGAVATVGDGERLRIEAGSGVIEYAAGDPGKSGIVSILVSVTDLDARVRDLTRSGVPHEPTTTESGSRSHVTIGAEHANGIDVVLQVGVSEVERDLETVDAVRLDHVALVVRDLDAAARSWGRLTGCDVKRIGIHPVSNGAFEAARVALGTQMIELLMPVVGHDSPMARRLASRGEGPATMALPVRDLAGAIQRLSDIGIPVLRSPPHVMVHPRDTSGVLIQLTPRVAH